nr:MAG TPA: hypothetical protein [Caudoviricetes sp.]
MMVSSSPFDALGLGFLLFGSKLERYYAAFTANQSETL